MVWFVLLLWAVAGVDLLLGHSLLRYGILPRSVSGLPGIIFAPFLHGGFRHLMVNTPPLLVLGGLVLLHGQRVFFRTTIIITVLGGTGVWLMGRPSIHVGASSLIFGYFGYLVFRGMVKRSLASIAVSLVTVAAYGGILWGLIPHSAGVSWEGHLCGFLAGIFCARIEGA
ncbi:MAG: rhomboid family intramembrane serine protease [Desulfobacteraceae bacterium]|nr:rhomboid family intramembrane serine protease [Desulfobacteraceae bacterium]